MNNDTVESRLIVFKQKQRKQAILVTVVWFIIATVLTLIIASSFQINESPIRNLIYSFVIAAVFLTWVNFIPFLGILISIVIRTRSKNYFNQLLPNIGFLFIITVVALINFIEIREDPATFLFIGLLLVIIILESIFLRLVVEEARNNTKPLFIWTFFQDPFITFLSTFLTHQALVISEEENGYSQRPFFTSFSEILQLCSSQEKFHAKLKEYAIFLTEKSELIGWDCKNTAITLYPRVLIGNPDLGLGIRYLWDILVKVLRKRDLTYISINYISGEISLSISRQDYALLNNVTFHRLGLSLLERFKKSIITFLTNDPEKSLLELYSHEK
ncbi:MAG: hypothetical protein ACXADY_23515 [Candidatus Hodarchaeales archaeon]|jgi:hypothetical protein